ncbi:hypothetical protein BKA93DRAFT_321080 [Sparassis latifolia]
MTAMRRKIMCRHHTRVLKQTRRSYRIFARLLKGFLVDMTLMTPPCNSTSRLGSNMLYGFPSRHGPKCVATILRIISLVLFKFRGLSTGTVARAPLLYPSFSFPATALFLYWPGPLWKHSKMSRNVFVLPKALYRTSTRLHGNGVTRNGSAMPRRMTMQMNISVTNRSHPQEEAVVLEVLVVSNSPRYVV